MKKKILVVAVMLGVLAAFGIGATATFAQSPTPTPTTPGTQNPAPSWGVRGGRNGLGGIGYESGWYTKTQEILAKDLGLTVDQLYTELRAGKTVAQLASAKNVTRMTLHNDLQIAHKDYYKQLVKDGKLTQAQADALTAMLDAQDKVMQAFGLQPREFDGGFGFGERGAMMNGNAPSNFRGPNGNNGTQVPPQNYPGGTMGGRGFRR